MRRFFISFLIFAVILLMIPGGWYYILNKSFDKPLPIQEEVEFVVESGVTLTSVAYELEELGLLDKAMRLIWLARFEGQDPILAAPYAFTPGMTLRELYEAITKGESISGEEQVTIVEGLSLDEVAEQLVEQELLDDAEEFIDAASNNLERFTEEYEFLNYLPAGESLEGYLFPDTYRFFEESTVDDVISKLLDTFGAKVTEEMLNDIAKSDRSIHEVITLASLVQGEVRGVDEMVEVSGLLQNRLEIGMALQLDSTINYLTRSGRDRSTLEDLEIDSPYNTYRNPGLPPGPINNPGLDAIKAAIYPNQTDNLYFLTDKAGRVYYAETLEEHKSNRQYLDKE